MRSVQALTVEALLADLHVAAVATSTTIAATAATSRPLLLSLPCLGAGGLFPHPPKAMSLLTLRVATEVAAEEEEVEEDGEGDPEVKILKLVLDGGGTIFAAKCPDSLREHIIVGEVVKHHVFKCGWWRWRPCQTSGQGCGQVRKSIRLGSQTDIKACLVHTTDRLVQFSGTKAKTCTNWKNLLSNLIVSGF